VHVQFPGEPAETPLLIQKNSPSEPSFEGSVDAMQLVHVKPSPKYPGLQAHSCPPKVLVHDAYSLQL